MDNLTYRYQYRKNLPHIQPPGATLFLTFRLAGSLPAVVVEALQDEFEASQERLARIAGDEARQIESYREQRRQFGRWDAALDSAGNGLHWLNKPAIAELVAQALNYRDGDMYDLDCYTIMSNHVHVVFTPLEKADGSFHSLSRIMHSLKRYTAGEANKILDRHGQFWQHGSYDHIVRDGNELQRIRRYVLNNPVKAGLVETWEAWPWTYLKEGTDHL